jgi:hypothetical protein
MALTLLTVVVAAALGGGVPVDVTVVVIGAAVALGLIGLANGLRMLGELTSFLRR